MLNLDELYKILKPKEEGANLNVHVLFLQVINGDNIARVFKKLGVG